MTNGLIMRIAGGGGEGKAHGIAAPTFEVKQGWVVVTFRVAIVPEQRMDTQGRLGTQKTTQKTIQVIMKNPHVTRKELADSIGITNDGIKYHLTKMQKEGLLRLIGPDKGGHWEVVR